MTNACVCYALLITITTTVVLATPGDQVALRATYPPAQLAQCSLSALTIINFVAHNKLLYYFPELPRVEDVGAGLLRPSEVIVYWTHVSSSYGTAKYTVHYAPSTTDGETVQKSVASDTNFAIIDLEVGPEYTFQVSGSFVVNSSIMEGPLSVVTRDSRVQTVETAQSFTMKDIATIVFGMLLFVSISINVLLLLVNIVLLRHFRYTHARGFKNTSNIHSLL